MADNLVKTIKCGEYARGSGEVTSPRSATYKWTDSIGYGRAHDNAVYELDAHDAACKAELAEKVNKWLKSVKCVASEHCKTCSIARPNDVQPFEVTWEDNVSQKGNSTKAGELSIQRIYKVGTGYVRCMCKGTIVVG